MNQIDVRIVATANTKAARKEIDALAQHVRAANRDQRNALNILSGSGLNTQPIARIKSEVDELTGRLNRGKLAAGDFGRIWRDSTQIIRRQSELASASIATMDDKIRGIKSGTLIMDDFGNAAVRGYDKFRLMNTALAAQSQRIVDIGKNMQWAGRQITVGFTVPFGIAMGLAAREFMQVEDQIVRFEKVFNENLGTPLEEASHRVQNLSKTLVTEMGRAQEETLEVSATFAQMGKSIDEVERLTTETMRLSTLGEVPIETSTDLLRSLQAVYKFNNEELTKSVDLLNAIENNTSLTVAAMAESMPQIIPIFEQFNLELGEGTAILAGMNEILGNANEAATAFKAIAQRMFDPTQEAVDKFAEFGIDLPAIVARNEDDLIGFLVELGDILEENDVTAQEFAETFGNLMGVRQAGRGLSLITQTRDAMRGLENDTSRAMSRMGEDTENAADAQREMQAQLNSTANRFRRTIQEIKVQIVELGGIFLEEVMPIVTWARDLVTWFSGLSDGTKRWGVRLMALIALIGPIRMFGGIFVNLFGTVVGMLSSLFPALTQGWTAQSRAAHLAAQQTEHQDREARELVGTLFNLRNELNKTAHANQMFAASSRNAAMGMAAMMPGRAGRSARANAQYRIPKGMAGAGQFTTEALWMSTYSPEARLANKTSTKRNRTALPGGSLGALPGLMLLTSTLISQTTELESTTAKVANNIMMWGSLGAIAAHQFKGMAANGTVLSRIFSKVGVGISGLITKIGGKAGLSIGGLKAGGAGAVAVGGTALIGGIALVGIGIKKWIDNIDAAANKMTKFRDVVKQAESAFGLSDRGASIVTVDEMGNEIEKDTSEAIEAGLAAISSAPNESVAARRGRSLVLDIILRGGDIELVREMVNAMNKRLLFNIDIDTTSAETAIDSMREKFVSDLRGVFRDFANGKYNASVAGALFQSRDNSVMGDEILDEYAEAFASIVTSDDVELIKSAAEAMERFSGQMNPGSVNKFVDSVLEALDLGFVKGEVDTIEELLAELNTRLGSDSGLARALPTATEEVLAMKQAIEEMETAYQDATDMLGIAFPTLNDEMSRLIEILKVRGPDAVQQMVEVFNKLSNGMELTAEETLFLQNAAAEAGFNLEEMNYALDQGVFASSEFGKAIRWLSNLMVGEAELARRETRARRAQENAERRRRTKRLQEEMVEDVNAALEGYDVAGAVAGMGEDIEEEVEKVSLAGKRSAIDDMLGEFVNELMDAFDEMKDDIQEKYEAEKEAIKETTELAEERDKMLKESFEAELERQRKLQEELQTAIDYDAAIARGDLDSAAQINQDRMFGSIEEGYDEFVDELDKNSEARKKHADERIDAIEEEEEAALKAHDAKVEALEKELEVLNRTTPATLAEWNTRINKIDELVRKHGLTMNDEVRKFGVEGFSKAIDNWQTQVAEDARWSAMEEALSKKGTDLGNAVGDSFAERVKTLMDETEAFVSEKLFGGGAGDVLKYIEQNETDRSQPATAGGTFSSGFADNRTAFYHTGGKIKGMGEVPIIAQSDEFMMQRSAVQRYGLDFMEAINAGRFHEGGLVPGTSSRGGLFGMFDMFFAGIRDGFSALSGVLSQGTSLGGFAGQALSGGGDPGGYAGYNVQHSGGGALSIPQIFKLARSVGLNKSQAQLATAIALGESGGRPGAVGDVNLQNSKWGPSVGLWQVRSLRNQTGTGQARDVTRLKDPAFNARAMMEISRNGSYWTPWTVYTKDIYQRFLGDVQRQTMNLSKGGLMRNDAFANLHKGEAVLRAPVAKNLEQGIQKLSQGNMGNTYIFDIGEYHGTDENLHKFTRHVMKEIDKREQQRGRSRIYS